MPKRFLTLGILAIVLMGVFAPFSFVKAETYLENCVRVHGTNPDGSLTAYCQNVANDPSKGNKPMPGSLTEEQIAAQKAEEKKSAENAKDMSLGRFIYEGFAKGVGELLTKLSGFILSMVGVLFDAVMKYTVVEMATNLGSTGIGASITSAWETLRDVANMCFIFVLLYAAFKAMFELNFSSVGTTIRNIIIVALLINFSLFFSKVVIDASNIAAVGFYKSIVTANTTDTGTVTSEKTISTGYMYMLGLQTWSSPSFFNNPNLTDPTKILIIGVMSSIFLLVTAVILLITAVMFLARFIILIFLMILSPLALIAIIIPGQMDNFNKWKNALIDQSFFAPIFFAMTWVVFKVAKGMTTSFKTSATGADLSFIDTMGSSPTSSIGIVLNFVLIIGLAIAALIISKQMATRGATATAFKTISGGIGTVALGGAAWTGRKVIGGGSKMLSESSRLRNAASSGKWYSGAARASLWATNKGAKGSFDVRASDTLGKVPGLDDEMKILGKAGGKGGFTQAVEDKKKAKEKYAKEVYGQTDFEKDEAKKLEDKYKITKYAEEERIKKERKKEAKDELDAARLSGDVTRIKAAEDQEKEVEFKNKNKIFKDSEYLTAFSAGIKKDYENYAKAGERRQESFAKRLEGEPKNTGAAVTASVVSGVIGAGLAGPLGAAIGTTIGAGIGKAWVLSNKAAARKVKDEAKGPTKEKKLADAYKAVVDTDTDTTAPPAAPPPAAPSGGGTPPPAATPAGP